MRSLICGFPWQLIITYLTYPRTTACSGDAGPEALPLIYVPCPLTWAGRDIQSNVSHMNKQCHYPLGWAPRVYMYIFLLFFGSSLGLPLGPSGLENAAIAAAFVLHKPTSCTILMYVYTYNQAPALVTLVLSHIFYQPALLIVPFQSMYVRTYNYCFLFQM